MTAYPSPGLHPLPDPIQYAPQARSERACFATTHRAGTVRPMSSTSCLAVCPEALTIPGELASAAPGRPSATVTPNANVTVIAPTLERPTTPPHVRGASPRLMTRHRQWAVGLLQPSHSCPSRRVRHQVMNKALPVLPSERDVVRERPQGQGAT